MSTDSLLILGQTFTACRTRVDLESVMYQPDGDNIQCNPWRIDVAVTDYVPVAPNVSIPVDQNACGVTCILNPVGPPGDLEHTINHGEVHPVNVEIYNGDGSYAAGTLEVPGYLHITAIVTGLSGSEEYQGSGWTCVQVPCGALLTVDLSVSVNNPSLKKMAKFWFIFRISPGY